MTRKNATDFADHADWLAYVRREVEISEQAFVLASGRFELVRRFYEMRNFTMPVPFIEERRRVETLTEPERTDALELLNALVFASLNEYLFPEMPKLAPTEPAVPATAQVQLTELLAHLRRKNPYFAIWAVYKKGASEGWIADEWGDYLARELESETSEEFAFAQAMVELDQLLNLYQSTGRALPRLVTERVRFLHALGGRERMVHTRAILDLLTAELGPCTSA